MNKGGRMQTKQWKNLYEENKVVPFCAYAESEYISDYMKRNNNFYEIWLLRYIKNNYPKHGCIVDIGSNIGNHVKYYANFLSAEIIYCFEPHAVNFSLLKENLQERCIAYPCALGATRGKCSLTIPVESNSGHYQVVQKEIENDSIDLVPLDEFNFSNVTMIKIDVEGYEYDVVLGAIQTILKYKPVLFIETRDRRTIDLLLLLGYRMRNHFYEGGYSIGYVPTIEFVYEDYKDAK